MDSSITYSSHVIDSSDDSDVTPGFVVTAWNDQAGEAVTHAFNTAAEARTMAEGIAAVAYSSDVRVTEYTVSAAPALCAHGMTGAPDYSAHTGALLGVLVSDESHGDMYGSFFCPAN